MRLRPWSARAFIVATLLLCSLFVPYAPAVAISDNSSDAYAGDYTGGSLPIGTFIAFQYFGYFRSNAFVDSTGRELPNSHANIWEEYTRFAYFAELWERPLVIEAEVPFATLTDVNVPGTNNLVAGGLVDPVIHLTYFLINDTPQHVQHRWLGITNYFYLPLGRPYDNQKAINVSTPRQFTDVIQIGYTEGLVNVSPNLDKVFFDLIANTSLHTNGNSPLAVVNPASASVPGLLSYDTLTQKPSYDLKAFLRYEPESFRFFAIGIEKSWGGQQIATNGKFTVSGLALVVPLPNLPLIRDDFLRGHLEFQIPLGNRKDFTVATDVFHDFDRVGGFRHDFGVEFRLTKFFFPQTAKKESKKPASR
jgi:hypothetical protein